MGEPLHKVWISSLSIENYKSIHDAMVGLEEGLNIIIGRNGSGKTNLLEFINNFSRIDAYLLRRREKWRRDLKTNFSIEFSVKDGNHSSPSTFKVEHKKSVVEKEDKKETLNTFTVKKKNSVEDSSSEYPIQDRAGNDTDDRSVLYETDKTNHKRLRDELSFLRHLSISYVEFSIPRKEHLVWLNTPASLEVDSQNGANFSYDSNFSFFNNYEYGLEDLLTDELVNLEDTDAGKLEEIKQLIIQSFYKYSHKINVITQIKNYTPVDDIRLNPNINIYKQEDKFIIENLLVDFQINDAWIPWNHLSDGTKRAFHLIIQTVLVENGILLIEEPELGIHPNQLYQLLDYLQKKAFTNQVIISTHSPLVLDILPLKDLNAITIAKMTRTGSKFFKLTEQKIQKAQRYITEVGELSYFWLHSDLEDD